MSLADDLYRETILDHYHHPRNQGSIADASARIEGVNPLCGDEVTLYLSVDGNKISDVRLEAKGCSINMASGSMMSEAVKGHSLNDAHKTIELFKQLMMSKDEVLLPEELEDLEALEGVKKYPVRIKCALLPWNTLLEAIQTVEKNGKNSSEE